MRRIQRLIASLLILAMVLAWVPQIKAADTSSIKVMTYNIKNSNYSFSNVTSMITAAGADIVGMQEASSLQIGSLTSAMSSAGFSVVKGRGRNSSELNTEYNPIYYKADKFTLLRSGTFWLSDTGSVESVYEGSACYRICTWGYFQVVNSEDYFIVFNTHTDYSSADIVVKQLNCILKQIIVKTEELTNAWDRVILMGDMNTVSNYVVCKYVQGDSAYNGAYNPYTKQRLDEARQIAGSVTLNSFGNYYTQPSDNPTSDLDHIYVTPKGFDCTHYQVISNAAGSDHLPIMAELVFKDEHNYTYEYLENGTHLAYCDHCKDSFEESCTRQGGHCTVCGGADEAETFTLVTDASQLTDGRYVVLAAAAQGSYTGDFPYYAMGLHQDNGFNAISSYGFEDTARPGTITLEGSQLGELVWTLEGDTSGFTLRGNDGKAVCYDGQGLYYGNNAATTWTASHSTSNLHFAVKYNGSSYLSLRTDKDVLSLTELGSPLFEVVGNTDTGNYKMFFYKSTTGSCVHKNTKTETISATCTQDGSTTITCKDCGMVVNYTTIPAVGHDYNAVVTPPTDTEQGYTTYTCASCGDSYVTDYTDYVYNLTFVVPAGVQEVAPMTGNSGLVLPGVSGTPKNAPADTVFVGWVTGEYDNITENPNRKYVYEEGITVTISGHVTLYALYAYGSPYTERTFSLYDGSTSLYIGDTVIIVSEDEDYALGSVQGSTYREGVAITRSEDHATVTLGNEAVALLTIGWGVNGNAETSKVSFRDSQGYLYAASSTNNALGTKTTLDANGTFTLNRNTTYNTMNFVAQGSNTNNTIRYDAANRRFACYPSGEESDIQMYILTQEAVVGDYYTTVFHCTHSNAEEQGACDPTCTDNGYTGDMVCADCGKIITSGQEIEATGHSYESQVIAPTCSQDGYTNHICAICGDSYMDSYVNALGHNYQSVTDGNTITHTCTNCGDSYETVLETEPIETEPTEPITGEGQWVKVALGDIQVSDTVAITMTKDGTTWLLPNSGKGSNKQPLADIIGTVIGAKLATSAEVSAVSWNIIPTEGGCYIMAGENYLYTTASNNGMRVGSTAAVWNITDSYLSASDTGGTTRYLGVYNNQDWRAYTSINTNISGQMLEFWKLAESDSTEPTEPEPTEPEVTEPEVTEPSVGEGQWEKIDFAAIQPGDTIAITMGKDGTTWLLPNVGEGSNKQPLANVTGIISGTKLSTDADAAAVSWNVVTTEGGYYIMAGEKYLYSTASNNGVRVGSTVAVWNITDNYLTVADTGGTTRYLGVYNSQDWRAYTTINSNITGQTLEFWKLADSAATEPTEPEPTEPEPTEPTELPVNPNAKNGIYLENGLYYYYVNDQIQYAAGLVFVDGSYYYIRSGGYAAIGSYWVTNTNGITQEGFYIFAEDGKMILTDTSKTGIYLEDGKYYYYVEGEIQFGAGLVYVDGYYYYIRSGGYATTGEYWVSITNGLLPEGMYTFGTDGKMIMDTSDKTGIYLENGLYYYYVNGEIQYAAGLVFVDGAYYYIRSGGYAAIGSYWVTNTNGITQEGFYIFAEDGKMILTDTSKNGIYLEDGLYYYYKDGEIQFGAGLVLVDGAYYYIRSGGYAAIGEYYVSITNGLMPVGTYTFGEDGKMIL